MVNSLITEFCMLGILGLMIVINTVLGTIIASKKQEFDINKLLNGITKAIVIALCILLFCITLELVPVVLSRVNIKIPSDLITVFEIVLTTLTAYKKYATDSLDKFKKILNVKESEK